MDASRHALDGPGVTRPLAHGVLQSASLRPDGDIGTLRVVTLNMRQAVPPHLDLLPRNEQFAALTDVARYVRSIDADIVMLQEMRDRPASRDRPGLANQAATIGRLMGASDAAFTPAMRDAEPNGGHALYGTATYARNGLKISQAHAVALPRGGSEERRVAGLSVVRTVTGDEIVVVNAHLAYGNELGDVRARQLDAVASLAQAIRADEAVGYRDALTGARVRADHLPSDAALVVGGDLNMRRDNVDGMRNSPDEILPAAGMTNVRDGWRRDSWVKPWAAAHALAPTRGLLTIDHLYATSELAIRRVAVEAVPPGQTAASRVTDHRAVVADVELPARS